MPKQAYYIATAISTLLVIALLGWTAHYRGTELERIQGEVEALQATLATNLLQLTNTQVALEESGTRLTNLQREAEELQQQLQKEREAAVKTQASIESEMRAALESKDVTISELQGRLTVNIVDRVLFDSGEAVLKPEGEAILQKVATVLSSHTNRVVHVAGHTDNVPIRASARQRYASNWELSTARATAAVRFLSEKAGMNPGHLGAIGYGEFHPVADNETPEGRARNRRIEIVILPTEIVGRGT